LKQLSGSASQGISACLVVVTCSHAVLLEWWFSRYTHKTSGFKTSGLKRPVSKRLKRQVYKTSALQNVRFTKCQVYKTSGLQNVRLQKNIYKFSVLVVGGNPQVLLQPCLQAK
jgi:hypothetical protein